jgi:hypothetical protein
VFGQKTLTRILLLNSNLLLRRSRKRNAVYSRAEVREIFPVEALILTFLLSAAVGAQFAGLATANPSLLYFKPHYCGISIQSPQNRTYNAEPIYLNFTVKTNYSVDAYSYFYVFDGQDWQAGIKVEEIQVIGESVISDEVMPDINTTYFPYTEYTLWGQAVLANMSYGRHSLTVYAMDSDGKVAALKTITFNIISEQEPQVLESSEPFPAIWVMAAAVSVAVFGVGFFIYLKRNRHKSREQPFKAPVAG